MLQYATVALILQLGHIRTCSIHAFQPLHGTLSSSVVHKSNGISTGRNSNSHQRQHLDAVVGVRRRPGVVRDRAAITQLGVAADIDPADIIESSSSSSDVVKKKLSLSDVVTLAAAIGDNVTDDDDSLSHRLSALFIPSLSSSSLSSSSSYLSSPRSSSSSIPTKIPTEKLKKKRRRNHPTNDNNGVGTTHQNHRRRPRKNNTPKNNPTPTNTRQQKSPLSRFAKQQSWIAHVQRTIDAVPPGQLRHSHMKLLYPAMAQLSNPTIISTDPTVLRQNALIAEGFLRRLREEDITCGNTDVGGLLSTKVYNAVVRAWSRWGAEDGYRECRRLLYEMYRLYKEMGADTKPDANSFSYTIQACVRQQERRRTSGRRVRDDDDDDGGDDIHDAAVEAEAMMQLMIDWDVPCTVITINSVLNALGKSDMKDKAIRAEALVKAMMLESSSSSSSSLSSTGDNEKERKWRIKPDVYTYQCILYAWSNSGVHGAPQRCEQILMNMLHAYDNHTLQKRQQLEDGDRVDTTTPIDDDNAPPCPNVYCFAATINAWAKSREANKARSAYGLLQSMTKSYQQNSTSSSSSSSSSKNNKYKNNHDREPMKPNVFVYTSVLNACRPSTHTERADAFQIARLTLEEMLVLGYDTPNHVTYAAFLSICAHVRALHKDAGSLSMGDEVKMVDARKIDDAIRWAFHLCREDGQVSNAVLENLQRSASIDLYIKLLEEHGSMMDDIPASWRRNVKGERYKKKGSSRARRN